MEAQVKALCDVVARKVISTGVVNHSNLDKVSSVMKEEVKSFLFGEEYASVREAVKGHAVHDGYTVGLIVTNCVSKIRN